MCVARRSDSCILLRNPDVYHENKDKTFIFSVPLWYLLMLCRKLFLKKSLQTELHIYTQTLPSSNRPSLHSPQRHLLQPFSAPSRRWPNAQPCCGRRWWRSCRRRCRRSWTRARAPGRWRESSWMAADPRRMPGWRSSSASRRPDNTNLRLVVFAVFSSLL